MIDNLTNSHDEPTFLNFDEGIKAVDKQVENALLTAPLPVRKYTRHLAKGKGKYIRAYTLLACAEDKDGNISLEAVYAATGIELLHLATLVHDDVIDNAPTRRGISSLQKEFGRKTAVLCGDYLFCAALLQVANIKERENSIKIERHMSSVLMGEIRQHQNNGNPYITFMDYLKIISGKTAALFQAAALGGAVLCPDVKEELKLYGKLGRYMGMIFQLTDDCIDFEETAETAKKPVQSDYEQGVITLPLIYAFQRDSAMQKKAAEKQLSKAEVNEGVARHGGIKFTKGLSKKYYDKGIKTLNSINMHESKRERLAFLFDKSINGLKG